MLLNPAIKCGKSEPANGNMRFTILTSPAFETGLHIRYPSWAADGVVLKVNNRVLQVKQKPGTYLVIKRKWKTGDKVEVTYPMKLHLVPTNDNPNVAAVADDPIVLAREMGTRGMKSPAPSSNPKLYNDYYTYDYNVPSDIISSLTLNQNNPTSGIMAIRGKPLTFKTLKEGVTLRPLFDIHRERYVVYWHLTNSVP